MKKLANLSGAKALNKEEQVSIFGGIDDNDSRIPTPTGDGNSPSNGGSTGGSFGTGGGQPCGYPSVWCEAKNRCLMPVHTC